MHSLHKLLTIMKQLRDPVTGCEWDRVQMFDSITSCTLEETYEVLDAIDQKNYVELKNELGDLLYQIVFYSEMAKEQGLFDFGDVCEAISDKLINRHPHIFGEKKAGEQKTEKPNWEILKQKERQSKQQFSLLDDIPRSLPALMRAEKIQKRCASVGFDWDNLLPVFDKVKEELDEVLVEINQPQQDHAKIEEEMGDLLFATVNLTRHLLLKSEITLQKANQKFERRFRGVEHYFHEKGFALSDVSLDEMEQAWQFIKQNEKTAN